MGKVGRAGNHIRIVTTTNPVNKAISLFEKITKNAINKTTQSNGTIVANMRNGNKIIYRPLSASTSGYKASINLSFKQIWAKERIIKFQ